MQSSFTTDKMYAVVLNERILGPFYGNEEELNKLKVEYPDHKFYEMTLENSPVTVGAIWKEDKEKVNA